MSKLLYVFPGAVLVAVLASTALAFAAPAATAEGPILQVCERDLQTVLDAAPPYATVDAGWILREIGAKAPLTLRHPVRLIHLKARLADGVASTPLVRIDSEGVTIEEFHLTGNHPSVPQSKRASLIRVAASHFRIENGTLLNSTRHGVHIEPDKSDIHFGIVRNIQGRGNQRDTVSVAGRGEDGLYTTHVLVENVTSFDNNEGGGVEVKDGSRNVTVRNVFTRGGEYSVDIQDHRKPGQSNHDVLVDGVHGERVHMAVTTNAGPFGHTNFTIRNVTGRDFSARLGQRSRVDIRHVQNVILENIRISDNNEGDSVAVQYARGVVLRNVTVENQGDLSAPEVRLVDVSDALVDGVFVRGKDRTDAVPALQYELSAQAGANRQLRIANVFAADRKVGIQLERQGGNGRLTNYSVAGNLAHVVDHIADPSAQLANNLD